MSKCDLNGFGMGVSPVNLLHTFRIPFLQHLWMPASKIPKESYISPEERQKIIDDLRLI